jgi:hypothetical protein
MRYKYYNIESTHAKWDNIHRAGSKHFYAFSRESFVWYKVTYNLGIGLLGYPIKEITEEVANKLILVNKILK